MEKLSEDKIKYIMTFSLIRNFISLGIVPDINFIEKLVEVSYKKLYTKGE